MCVPAGVSANKKYKVALAKLSRMRRLLPDK
jgi:hypothetical protein